MPLHSSLPQPPIALHMTLSTPWLHASVSTHTRLTEFTPRCSLIPLCSTLLTPVPRIPGTPSDSVTLHTVRESALVPSLEVLVGRLPLSTLLEHAFPQKVRSTLLAPFSLLTYGVAHVIYCSTSQQQ